MPDEDRLADVLDVGAGLGKRRRDRRDDADAVLAENRENGRCLHALLLPGAVPLALHAYTLRAPRVHRLYAADRRSAAAPR